MPSLQWRHKGCDNISNHQHYDCLLNRLFRRRSKKTSKLRVTGLYAGNSPGTGEFPAQMASNAENASIWSRHHVISSWWVNVLTVCRTSASCQYLKLLWGRWKKKSFKFWVLSRDFVGLFEKCFLISIFQSKYITDRIIENWTDLGNEYHAYRSKPAWIGNYVYINYWMHRKIIAAIEYPCPNLG